MTTITPSSASPSPTTPSREELISYLSWGVLIACPIVILLPPRKLDAYTLGLLGATFVGGNQVSKQYTGVSMVERFSARANALSDRGLPPKAMETQRRIRVEKEERERIRLGGLVGGGVGEGLVGGLGGEKKDGGAGVMGEIERIKRQEEEEKKGKGLLEKVWMGDAGEDWKAKRDQREREALEEGRGYGGLIVDQIWEVWNWGREKNEKVREMDEKVVEARKVAKEEEKREEGKR